jgi:hypothetical protein
MIRRDVQVQTSCKYGSGLFTRILDIDFPILDLDFSIPDRDFSIPDTGSGFFHHGSWIRISNT